MDERIEAELALARQWFPGMECREEGRWFLVPAYQIPNGWNRAETDVAFQIAEGYPRQPPYGFYVPSGLLFEGDTPGSYTEPAHNQPPFGGVWGFFSWAPDDWKPATEIGQGTNLLNWVNGFKERFRDGK